MVSPWLSYCSRSTLFTTSILLLVRANGRDLRGVYGPCGRVLGTWERPLLQHHPTSSKEVRGQKGISIVSFSVALQRRNGGELRKSAGRLSYRCKAVHQGKASWAGQGVRVGLRSGGAGRTGETLIWV